MTRRARRTARIAAAGLALAAVAAAADPLAPVVVTATRVPVEELDYAGSATRLDADAIASLGPVHSSELLNRAPGTFLQRGSGQEVLVAIRSPVLTGAGACGAFLVLEDGIPIRPVGFCNANELFEVNFEQAAAVDVLRGPGIGVLGANAVHGVVNVVTAKPDTLPPVGVSVETGSDDWKQIGLAGRAGDGPTRAGFAAHYTHDGGFRADSGFDEWKANGNVERALDSGKLWASAAVTDLDQQTAGFIVGQDAYKDPTLARSNPNPEAFRRAKSLRIGLGFSGTTFDATLYGRTSHMTFLQHFLLGEPLEDNAQHSVGVMLDAHGTLGRVAWRTGLDLEAARTDLVEFQANPTTGGSAAANRIRPAGLHYDYVVDSRVAAPWAAAEWTIVPSVKATLAVRGEYVHYAYDNRMIDGNTAANGTPCGASGCLYSRPADRTDRFTNVAPRVGVAWRFAERHSAYVSFAKGYRPPETTELYRLQRQQNIADIGSENVESYEVGLRGALGGAGAAAPWPGTLSYELAAFAMDKRDVILRDSTGFNIDNGRTRHRGLEYQLAWQPWSRLTLSAAGTHAAHTYRFDSNADGGEVIRSGNDIDTAPRNLGAVRLALRPTDATEAELEWLRVGRYSADAANLHWYPGHELLNLRTGLRFGDGFALRARVMNLTNRAYADRADYAFGNWRYFPGRERTWFVELAYAAPGGPGGSR